jgi:hypothetical protein
MCFFAQVFLELSSYKSAESYKSKMMMSLTLCMEYELIYSQEFEKGKEDALKLIIEELISTIKEDKVSKNLLTFSLDAYEKKGLNNHENIELQLNIVKLIKEELAHPKYLKNAIEFLDSNPSLSDLTIVTSNLISLLNYLNFKNSYLFYACKKYFEIKKKEYSVNSFFQEMIFNLSGNYTVYIEIEKMPNIIDKDFFQENLDFIHILTRREQKELKDKRIFTTDEMHKILKFNSMEANNPYKAISDAKRVLLLMDISYNVFEHKDKIQIAKGNSLAVDIKEEKKYYFNNEVSNITHQKNLQQKSLKERFFHFSSNFMIGSESYSKFEKSLILHSYAVRNDNPENQLIFFWNALETLTHKKNNKSIIESVIQFVVPFLKKRYFFENFKYVYSHIVQYQKELFQGIFEESSLHLTLENFIKVLVVKDNDMYDEIRTKIFSDKLNEFPLLRNRLFKFYEFHEAKKIIERLEMHEKSLTQQIKRVYRYRNLIVHDSKNIDETNIDTLLSNIHNYFDYVMDEIIEHSHYHKILNINELHLYLNMQLDSQKESLLKNEILTEENYLDMFLIDKNNSELKF